MTLSIRLFGFVLELHFGRRLRVPLETLKRDGLK